MFDYIDRYDWVIFGGTDGARRGAQFAASRGARVALMEPMSQEISPMERDRQMAKLGRLMGAGVDVVLEEWVWERSPASKGLAKLWSAKPPWLVRTETRWLWGDRYLYAETLAPQVPTNIQQLDILVCLSKDLDSYLAEEEAKKSWVVVGGDGVAIAQCQQLAQRGNAVTLLLPQRCLVDGLYEPADRYLQNLLEIDGVEIIRNVPPSSITAQQIPPETDQILIATQPTPLTSTAGPNFATQNGRAVANRHLQTTLPYLYLSGSALGGHTLPSVSEMEALTAITHGLSKQWRAKAFPPIDYSAISWTLPTNPPVTQWGQTNPDASDSVAKINCEDGGSLWVMLQKNWRSQSKIIGAAGIGKEAQQAINTLATLRNSLGRSPWVNDLQKCQMASSTLNNLALVL